MQGFLHVSTIAAAFPDKTGYHYAHTKGRQNSMWPRPASPTRSCVQRWFWGLALPVLEGLRKLGGGSTRALRIRSGAARRYSRSTWLTSWPYS